MNAARKIIYEKNYNPIREYWEKIKEKPLFAEIEKLQTEIQEAELKENVSSAFLVQRKEELEKKIEKRSSLKKQYCVINTSWKVYRMYKEIIRFLDDPESEWEYNSERANHAIEFIENYCKHSKGKWVANLLFWNYGKRHW